ncbi:MAG: hypothetical protein V3U06_02745, partial [Candidatus Binatia bacterium]
GSTYCKVRLHALSLARLVFPGICTPSLRAPARNAGLRAEAQGRGGWRQAQAFGELTRRGWEGGRRGSDLLTQAGRFSPEEPHFW